MKKIAEYALVGSPDWFISGIVSVSNWNYSSTGGSAFLAFSSKPYIHIYALSLGLNSENSFDISYVGQIQAHHERISGLEFYNNPAESTLPGLISCGLDGLARHWRYVVDDWLLVNELNVRSIQDNLDPTAVSTCYHADSICLSLIGTNKGSIIVWNDSLTQNRSHFITRRFENEAVVHCAWETSIFVPDVTRIAVGYKKGIIGIYNYKLSEVTSSSSLTQISRFYAHERDVCHVVWKTPLDNEAEATSADLLTTGRDQMIKVWTVSNSWCCASAKVPGKSRKMDVSSSTNSSTKRNSSKNNSTGNPWISGCWNPNRTSDPNAVSVFCSGLHGELMYWDGKDPPTNVKSPSQGHTMIVFSILSIPQSPGYLITLSQDRLIGIWQVSDEGSISSVLKIQTLSAGVMALTQATYGTGPLIGGLSDGSLIIWRMHRLSNHDSSSDRSTRDKLLFAYPRGQQSSAITAVACHPMPKFENILVYGTESGIVEITDIGKLQKGAHKKSQSQSFSFGSTVYRVVWGPLLFGDLASRKTNHDSTKIWTGNPEQGSNLNESTTSDAKMDPTDSLSTSAQAKESPRFPYHVYSACKGKIFFHIGSSRPPIDISCQFPRPPNISKEDWSSAIRSDISFRLIGEESDLDHPEALDVIASRFSHLVAIGYRSGDVDIYAQLRTKEDENNLSHESVLFVCRLSLHSKGINCLCWSNCKYWIAIGSNETFITVSDLTTILVEVARKGSALSLVQMSTCLARLEGHCNRITGLDWSPHDPSLLLSCSFDGTANVWRLCDDKHDESFSVSNFRSHRLRLFTCMWSRLEPDLAFTGGELCHFFGWRPSEQSYTIPPNSRRYRPPPIKRLTQPDKIPEDKSAHSSEELKFGHSESINISSESIKTVHELKNNEAETKENTIIKDPLIYGNCVTPKINQMSSGEKRKRPALLPAFLRSSSSNCCKFDINLCPPIDLSSKINQILYVSHYGDTEISDCDKNLLLLLPENTGTRRHLINYVKQEASNHFDMYKSNSKTGSSAHLDAYCMLLLWLGNISHLSKTMINENHMPFWLLLAIQLCKSNPVDCYSVSLSNPNQFPDLIGEKVKEIVSNSQDTLVAATLLVCASRTREAVELLLSHDKCKEALIMARLRLDPVSAKDVVSRSVDRLDERRLSTEMPHVKILYSIGCKDWIQVRSLIHRELGSLKARSNKDAEIVAWLWIEISFLVHDTSEDLLIKSYLRLTSLCLAAGFKHFSAEPRFFDHWSMAFIRLNSNLPDRKDFSLCLLLLKLGRFVCTGLSQSDFNSIEDQLNASLESIECPAIYLSHLMDFATDRQPSNQWEVCLMNLCVDSIICLLILRHNHTLDQIITNAEYFRRFQLNSESCIRLKPDICKIIQILPSIFTHCRSDLYSALLNYLAEQ